MAGRKTVAHKPAKKIAARKAATRKVTTRKSAKKIAARKAATRRKIQVGDTIAVNGMSDGALLTRLLKEQAPEPVTLSSTLYIVLGDGRRAHVLKALLQRRQIKRSQYSILSIDPAYKKADKAKSARKFIRQQPFRRAAKLIPRKAEGFSAELPRGLPAGMSNCTGVVVIAHCAHTDVGHFLTRLKAALPKKVKLYAACVPCCYPGIRRPTKKLPFRWGHHAQLKYPQRRRPIR